MLPSKTSFTMSLGALRTLSQIEMLRSSDPSATMDETLPLEGLEPSGRKMRGLNA